MNPPHPTRRWWLPWTRVAAGLLLAADLVWLAWPGAGAPAARLAVAGAGLVLLLWLLWPPRRAARDESAQAALLEQAIAALPTAVALFDERDRLVLANPEFHAANAPLADLLQEGMAFEAFVRARVQRGLVPDAVGREQEWIAARLASHRNPGPPMLLPAGDGRQRRVVERRLDGGGVLLLSTDVTDQVRSARALDDARHEVELAHQRLVDAIEAMPATFELYDADDRLVMHNQALARAYPHLAPVLGQRLLFAELARMDAAHSGQAELLDELDEWLARREAQRRTPQQAGSSTLIATPDGRWMRMVETRLRDGGMVAIRVDVTEVETQRAALDDARRVAGLAMTRLEDAIEALPAAFELYDADDRLVLCNRRLREMYPLVNDLLAGHPSFEEMVRTNVARGGLPLVPRGAAFEDWLAQRQAQRRHPGQPQEQLPAAGTWVQIHERRLRDGGLVAVRVDVSEQKRRELELIELNRQLDLANAELSRLSETDELTGLANRRKFDRWLGQEWSRAVRHGLPLALAIFDVDYFKRYNDRHGHPAGDACLRAVADVLRAEARRAGDVVARLGGEEFAVLLPHHDAQEALALAQRCLAALECAAIAHGDSPLGPRVSCSAGVADLAGTGAAQGPAALVAAADEALYAAKQAGRNRALAAVAAAPAGA